MKRKKPKVPPPTSPTFDSIEAELRFGGDREAIEKVCRDIAEYLQRGNFPKEYVEYVDIGRAPKKNFAQRFSAALAQKIANELRHRGLDEVLPNASGGGHETEARGGDAIYRIDVNYSTRQGGLSLAISVKTVNFRDARSKRYTKNIRRADKELRAEADECHKRHPYAVLAAVVLMPVDAAFDEADGNKTKDRKSSLKHAWSIYRHRGGRESTRGEEALFENVFIGVYQTHLDRLGVVSLFDVTEVEPPAYGLPEQMLTLTQVLDRIYTLFTRRNPRR